AEKHRQGEQPPEFDFHAFFLSELVNQSALLSCRRRSLPSSRRCLTSVASTAVRPKAAPTPKAIRITSDSGICQARAKKNLSSTWVLCLIASPNRTKKTKARTTQFRIFMISDSPSVQ